MVKIISDKSVKSAIESDDEEAEDGEGEVITLAKRCLELLGRGPKNKVFNQTIEG